LSSFAVVRGSRSFATFLLWRGRDCWQRAAILSLSLSFDLLYATAIGSCESGQTHR
jgi:hypothetical protein